MTGLLLCSGRGSELWGKFSKLNGQLTEVWKLLRKEGIQKTRNSKPNGTLTNLPDVNVTNPDFDDISLLEYTQRFD